jgi:hypothetical protein
MFNQLSFDAEPNGVRTFPSTYSVLFIGTGSPTIVVFTTCNPMLIGRPEEEVCEETGAIAAEIVVFYCQGIICV